VSAELTANVEAGGLRQAVKRCAFALAFVLVSPLAVAAWVEQRVWRGELLFQFGTHLLALFPGILGVHVRAAFYYMSLDACSWETHVGFGSIFTHRGAILGRRSSMGSYCVLGHVKLGDGVMLGSRVSIPSGRRQHIDETGAASDATTFSRVAVGKMTWVGEGAIIMADVGSHCIVGAGSVVTKAFPDGCVIAGNPARLLRGNPGHGEVAS
jgi:acetyltransferase-like isoleucine patch superfamily enzyme